MLGVILKKRKENLCLDCSYIYMLRFAQAIGGVLEEFIFSPRLDNLLNAYTAAVVGVTDLFCFYVFILFNHLSC